MKKIKFMLVAMMATIGIASLQNSVVYAEDSLAQEEAQIEALENKISTALADINEHRLANEVLSKDIEDLLAEQQELKQEIANQQKMVDEREDFLKKHLVSMQISNFAHNGVMQLVNAENFTDFMNRLMIIGQLFNAEETTINTIVGDISDLEKMEQTVEENKQILIEKQEKAEEESKTMTAGIHELQKVLSENKAVFAELMKRKAEEEKAKEEKRLQEELAKQQAEQEALAKAEAEEKAQAEQEAKEKAEQEALAKAEAEKAEAEEAKAEAEKAEAEETDDSAETEEIEVVEPTKPAPVEPIASGDGYKIIAVEATAYSYQEAGLTHHTASGIDLRENSMVIAVDPNVIPLGTLVEVPGYGIAIAGDTGGAIKGNRIDVHFPDVATCHTFGRQHIEIKVFL